MSLHQHYMQQALKLAEKGQYTVSPNPMVGCVIVRDEKIIASGWHAFAGGPHAEINALNSVTGSLERATLYVTLEPCAHQGKTPPCVKALIASGIKHVVVACLDPNPKVSGRGIRELQSAGIQVEVGVCEQAARALNAIFFHYHQHQKPFVIAKWAMSLDGKTQVNEGDDLSISSSEARQHTHYLRNQVDAILVGANTVRHDNPRLNVRHLPIKPIRHPLKIIVSRTGDLSPSLKVFQSGETQVFTGQQAPQANIEALREKKVKVVVLPTHDKGEVDLNEVLIFLGKQGVTSVLVEGGDKIHQRFLDEGLVNQVYAYVSPVLISGFKKKKKLENVVLERVGDNHVFIARLKEEAYV